MTIYAYIFPKILYGKSYSDGCDEGRNDIINTK